MKDRAIIHVRQVVMWPAWGWVKALPHKQMAEHCISTTGSCEVSAALVGLVVKHWTPIEKSIDAIQSQFREERDLLTVP